MHFYLKHQRLNSTIYNFFLLLEIHISNPKTLLFLEPYNKISMNISCLFLQLFFGLTLLLGLATSDPDPLQDYCIADTKSPLFLNGAPCLNPSLAHSSHFTTSALAKPGDTKSNPIGFSITLTTLANLPGINTMGLTMARVDIASNGLVPPHSHPRASEVTICLKGVLLVGFVDTSNRLFTQQLGPGDSFVFPRALIHFLYNLDSRNPALAVSGLSSQNPGVQIASRAIFVSNPSIPDVILEKAFQISSTDIAKIRRNLGG
ncbi:germin-like protein subfamily 1 member 1 [Durio zibethinus]|uniref:Germin-like protein n=1 Tax=Durio zibethinus TaxID=66656 RepID=A0A6P6BEN0_DURZI|nr:germin-like protein subfamily 1 member 1 [Durio zibethinus]